MNLELNNSWTNAEGERDGSIFFLRFRPHLQNFIESKKYETRLDIEWNYESNDSSLLPSDEVFELMRKVEDALVDALEGDHQAILSFAYLGHNQRIWYWYSSDIAETKHRLNKALSNFEVLPIKIYSQKDLEWAEYNSVLESVADEKAE